MLPIPSRGLSSPRARMVAVSTSDSLLDQIERDVLDEGASLAGALRKCLALGGESGSEELRDWATLELQGYKDLEKTPLPDYRIVPAPLLLDGLNGYTKISNQIVPPSLLPDFARDDLKSEVQFRQGAGEIEALIKGGEREGAVRISPPMMAELVQFMNVELRSQGSHVERIFWAVSVGALKGVTDQIRTALTQLVAEVRAATPRGRAVPTTEAVDHAMQVVVHGRRARVNVSAAQASGEAVATVGSVSPDKPTESEFWTVGRRIGAFIVGASSVALMIFAAIRTF